MEKKNIFKRIKEFFQRKKAGKELALSIVNGTRKAMGITYYEPVRDDFSVVEQTTEIEPDIVVYDKETMELKYVAIDKLFGMQERFSKKEYFWIKLMVTDRRFLKAYFEGTNEALIDYLENIYKEGRFNEHILSVMESLGMVVLSYSDRIRFIDVSSYGDYSSLGFLPHLLDEYKIESNNKKKS